MWFTDVIVDWWPIWFEWYQFVKHVLFISFLFSMTQVHTMQGHSSMFNCVNKVTTTVKNVKPCLNIQVRTSRLLTQCHVSKVIPTRFKVEYVQTICILYMAFILDFPNSTCLKISHLIWPAARGVRNDDMVRLGVHIRYTYLLFSFSHLPIWWKRCRQK